MLHNNLRSAHANSYLFCLRDAAEGTRLCNATDSMYEVTYMGYTLRVWSLTDSMRESIPIWSAQHLHVITVEKRGSRTSDEISERQ